MSRTFPSSGFNASILYVPTGVETPIDSYKLPCPLIRSIADPTEYFAVLSEKTAKYGCDKTYHIHHNHSGYFLQVYDKESNTVKWENLKGLDEYDDKTVLLISVDMDGNLGIVKKKL